MYDSILNEIGAVGRHQILTLILCNCLKCFAAVFTFIPVLTNFRRHYSCMKWDGVPADNSTSCDAFINNNSTCSEWEFSKDVMHSTIYSQYQLICSKEYLVKISVTIYFIGFTLGCALYGKASDTWGRFSCSVISSVNLLVISIVVPLTPYFWLYCVFRFLAGMGTGGVLVTGYTLTVEVSNDKYRLVFCILLTMGWSIGIMLVAIFGYFIRDHVWLQIYLCFPYLITIIISGIFLKESARWLFDTGRTQRFRAAIKLIAKRNGRPMPRNSVLINMESKSFTDDKPSELTAPKISFKDIFRFRRLCLVVSINWISWLCVSCGYYMSSLGVGLLGGNIFLTLGLNGFLEMPVRLVILYISSRVGRVPIITGGFIIGGLSCIVSVFLIENTNLTVLLITLNMIGKIAFLNAFEFIWLYTAELYPTSIRNNGVGLGSMWARIGAMLSPMLLLLHGVRAWAPFLLLGIVSLIVGCAILLIPETMGLTLRETLKDADTLCRKPAIQTWTKKNTESRNDCDEEIDELKM